MSIKSQIIAYFMISPVAVGMVSALNFVWGCLKDCGPDMYYLSISRPKIDIGKGARREVYQSVQIFGDLGNDLFKTFL